MFKEGRQLGGKVGSQSAHAAGEKDTGIKGIPKRARVVHELELLLQSFQKRMDPAACPHTQQGYGNLAIVIVVAAARRSTIRSVGTLLGAKNGIELGCDFEHSTVEQTTRIEFCSRMDWSWSNFGTKDGKWLEMLYIDTTKI